MPKQYIYIVLGLISLALAYIGVVMPGIPGTPFIILTAWFFVRSSDKLYNKLLHNRLFGKILSKFTKGEDLSLKTKLWFILPVWGSAIVTDILLAKTWMGHAIIGTAIVAYTVLVLMIKRIDI